jgi:hypothetical protein
VGLIALVPAGGVGSPTAVLIVGAVAVLLGVGGLGPVIARSAAAVLRAVTVE